MIIMNCDNNDNNNWRRIHFTLFEAERVRAYTYPGGGVL